LPGAQTATAAAAAEEQQHSSHGDVSIIGSDHGFKFKPHHDVGLKICCKAFKEIMTRIRSPIMIRLEAEGGRHAHSPEMFEQWNKSTASTT
jgi:hypothetical protein